MIHWECDGECGKRVESLYAEVPEFTVRLTGNLYVQADPVPPVGWWVATSIIKLERDGAAVYHRRKLMYTCCSGACMDRVHRAHKIPNGTLAWRQQEAAP